MSIVINGDYLHIKYRGGRNKFQEECKYSKKNCIMNMTSTQLTVAAMTKRGAMKTLLKEC